MGLSPLYHFYHLLNCWLIIRQLKIQDTNVISNQPPVSIGLNFREMGKVTWKLAIEYPEATFLIAYGHFSGKGCMGARFDDSHGFKKTSIRTFCSVNYRLNWQPCCSCSLSFAVDYFVVYTFLIPSTALHEEKVLLNTLWVDFKHEELEQSSLCSIVKSPFCANDVIQSFRF